MLIFIILIFLLLFLILTMPILAIQKFTEQISMKRVRLRSLRLVQWAFKVIIRITGAKVTTIGRENIPDSASLYVANHLGIFDTVICYSQMKGLTGFISKDNVRKVPLLNLWMMQLYCLFLNRNNPREGLKVVLGAIELVKNGISIFVFPEGTRSKDGEVATFKEGTFKIATKSGAKIVPIAISGTDEILEKQFPLIKPNVPVIIHYGDPIDPNELTAEEKKHIGEYTRRVIQNLKSEDEKLLAQLKS